MTDSSPVVLVLGARSVLARHLIPHLQQAGYELIATSRTGRDTWDPGVHWLQADPVGHREDFLSTLRDHLGQRPLSGVINLLGSWMRGEPRAVLVDTPRWLLPALAPLAEPKAQALFISGTAVYGHRPGELLTETASLRPTSQLGTLLVAGEEAWQQTTHFTPVILRFPHLYGEADDRVMGLMASGAFFIPGDGHNITHHLHWEDAARATAQALLRAPAGVYHWADASRTSLGTWCDFITDHRRLPSLSRYALPEAIAAGAAAVLGPHMNDPDRVRELCAVMAAEINLDTSWSATQLQLSLRYPDPYPVLQHLLSSLDP